jgi:hypothetical protein
MLDLTLAQSIANTVAPKIVGATKGITVPEESWKEIVKIIVEEVFNQIKNNAVVKLDAVAVSPANLQASLATAPGGGPVTGTISPPTSPITGKIT